MRKVRVRGVEGISYVTSYLCNGRCVSKWRRWMTSFGPLCGRGEVSINFSYRLLYFIYFSINLIDKIFFKKIYVLFEYFSSSTFNSQYSSLSFRLSQMFPFTRTLFIFRKKIIKRIILTKKTL